MFGYILKKEEKIKLNCVFIMYAKGKFFYCNTVYTEFYASRRNVAKAAFILAGRVLLICIKSCIATL